MIKSISFQKEFIPLIKLGVKTVTRRINTNLMYGDVCYFKAGRIGRKKGYLKICSVTKIRLRDIRGDFLELKKEGLNYYNDCIITTNYFISIWDELNNKKGFRYEDNPLVYRIEFEYLGKESQ